jgi:hypothetical protein
MNFYPYLLITRGKFHPKSRQRLSDIPGRSETTSEQNKERLKKLTNGQIVAQKPAPSNISKTRSYWISQADLTINMSLHFPVRLETKSLLIQIVHSRELAMNLDKAETLALQITVHLFS